jgi:broad specificity phosphatase PhoE
MPENPTRLLLVRHAEVERTYQKIFGGKIDMNLSPRGHEQAAVLAKFLRTRKLDVICASPMKRVQQTLAPFLKNGAPKQKIYQDLREVDFGGWTGLNWQQVSKKFNLLTHDWLGHIEQGIVPNGESGPQFRKRIEPCIRQIIKKHRGKAVGVFCHGGVIRMILSILLELPLRRTNMFEVEYTGVTEITLHPDHAEIELLNFTPWRDLLPDGNAT